MGATVYIETTVISYLTARPSNDPVVAGHMVDTRTWWEQTRKDYDLVASEIVIAEASGGDKEAAQARLNELAAIELIPVTDSAKALAVALVSASALPSSAYVDALHIATAAASGINYLLKWNCRHLANATLRSRIEQVCADHGFRAPVICTPPELQRGASMNDDSIDADPIVAEVRRIREELFARYNHDLDAFVKDMQARTEAARLAGRKVVALPPRRPKDWTEATKKAG
jgi:hypothetical protein